MPDAPCFGFFLDGSEYPVTTDSSLWQRQLPMSRQVLQVSGGLPQVGGITYGDYFSAVQAYLKKRDFQALRVGLAMVPDGVSFSEFEEIDVFLIKHGEWYHPAKIEVRGSGGCMPFILNVAVSRKGKGGIAREYQCLKRLNRTYPYRFIPRAYHLGCGYCANEKLPMFLGEWIDGFYEFHVTGEGLGTSPRVAVWDRAQTRLLLTPPQVFQLFRQAAMILTAYYHPLTFKQIFPWHLAAGDFVVRLEDGRVTVKLITARDYGPFWESEEGIPAVVGESANGVALEAETVFQAFAVFLLHISFRLRLDRLDGVGDLCWIGEPAAEAIVTGFFQGVNLIAHLMDGLERLPSFLWSFLSSFSQAELRELGENLLERYPSVSEEEAVSMRNLPKHIEELHTALAGLDLAGILS